MAVVTQGETANDRRAYLGNEKCFSQMLETGNTGKCQAAASLLCSLGFERPFCPWCSKANTFWLCCIVLIPYQSVKTCYLPYGSHFVSGTGTSMSLLTNALILKTGTTITSLIKPLSCLYRYSLLFLRAFGQHSLFSHHSAFPCLLPSLPPHQLS